MPETKEEYPCDECETRVENVYPDCQINCDRYTDHYKKILLEVEKRSKKCGRMLRAASRAIGIEVEKRSKKK